MVTFRIDGCDLAFEPGLLAAGSFTVRSSAGDYEVVPGISAAGGLRELVRSLSSDRNRFLFIDRRIRELYLSGVKLPEGNSLVFDATEDNKTMASVLGLVERMSAAGIDRNGMLEVVGGGITGDVGGLAASLYRRGIGWNFHPTTIVSMCDSSIGGKTGVNTVGIKNVVGSFHPPRKVSLAWDFLDTLEEREILSGCGELLKSAVLGGSETLAMYTASRDAGSGLPGRGCLPHLVGMALSLKRAVVEADETERGLRRALNYGHTFGHAYETVSGYRIPHGQAVALGMMEANRRAVGRGLLGMSDSDAIASLAEPLVSGIRLFPEELSKVAKVIAGDKKTENGHPIYVFIRSPGETVFRI